jgi:hypothetical protein
VLKGYIDGIALGLSQLRQERNVAAKQYIGR